MGNALYHLEEHENAITQYNHALRLDPGYEEAYKNSGYAHREAGQHYGEKVGDLPKAIESLTKAIQILPDDFETNRLLGVAYGISRDDAQAIQYFKKCTQIEPTNAEAWLNLGNAYANSGDKNTGLLYQRKAQSIDPNVGRRE